MPAFPFLKTFVFTIFALHISTVKMRKGLLLLLFLTITFDFAFASNPYIDSLARQKATIPNDSLRFDALKKLAIAYSDSAYDVSIMYWREALLLSKRKNNKLWIGDVHQQLGYMLHRKGELSEALEEMNSALSHYMSIKNYVSIAEVYNDMGLIYKSWGKYDKALECYQTAIPHFEKADFKEGPAMAANNIGQIYYYQEDYPKAIEYFTDYLVFNQKAGRHRAVAGAYNNIASAYMEMQNLDLALDYYQRALKLYDSLNIALGIAILNDNIGELYSRKGKYSEALSYHFRALNMLEKLNSKPRVSFVMNNIGYAFYKQKNYPKAIEFFTDSRVIAEELNQKEVLKEIYLNLSMVYEACNSYAQSLEAYKLYVQVKDSLYSLETKETLSTLEFQFMADKKARELEIVKGKYAQNRLMVIVVSILGLIIIFVSILLIYLFFRKKGELAACSKKCRQYETSLHSVFDSTNFLELNFFRHFSNFTIIPENIDPRLPFFLISASKNDVTILLEVCHPKDIGNIELVKLQCLEWLYEAIEKWETSSPTVLKKHIHSRLTEQGFSCDTLSCELTVSALFYNDLQKKFFYSGSSAIWHASATKAALNRIVCSDVQGNECVFEVNEGDTIYYLAKPLGAENYNPEGKDFISIFEKTLEIAFSSPYDDQKAIMQSTVDFWNSSYKFDNKFLMVVIKV